MNYSNLRACRKFFVENGFIHLKNVLTHNEKINLGVWAEDITNIAYSQYNKDWKLTHCYNQNLLKIENFSKDHNNIKEYINLKISNLIKDIELKPIYFYNDSLNFLPRGYSNQPVTDIKNSKLSTITAVIPLINNNLDNGCIHLGKNSLYVYDPDFKYTSYEWIPFELSQNDILLYKSHVPYKRNTNHHFISNYSFNFTFNLWRYGQMNKEFYDIK